MVKATGAVVIDRDMGEEVFPWADPATAQSELEGRRTVGKFLSTP